eukprot:CAMPEP_0170495458 /NCGR_PEP_ID=MMETSP0208-20121228/16039_1 /TAXON_ID=197538 /ORGANISM="Strombidium inclinatum, Strain S3" /LENGTH=141 /DNA_ID=CAMNT_0010771689 /DNA_START=144 /DNA_END=569 /DNA_ORIENTATION=-
MESTTLLCPPMEELLSTDSLIWEYQALEITQANLELLVATPVSPEPPATITDSPVTHLSSPATLLPQEEVNKDTTLERMLSSSDILPALIKITPPSSDMDSSLPTGNNPLKDSSQHSESSKPMTSPSKRSVTAMPATRWVG